MKEIKTQKEWEKEFEKNFVNEDKTISYHGIDAKNGCLVNIKSFITSLIKKAQEEERKKAIEHAEKDAEFHFKGHPNLDDFLKSMDIFKHKERYKDL